MKTRCLPAESYPATPCVAMGTLPDSVADGKALQTVRVSFVLQVRLYTRWQGSRPAAIGIVVSLRVSVEWIDLVNDVRVVASEHHYHLQANGCPAPPRTETSKRDLPYFAFSQVRLLILPKRRLETRQEQSAADVKNISHASIWRGSNHASNSCAVRPQLAHFFSLRYRISWARARR